MAEINTFPCRGLSIEVSSGDATTHAHIKYEENGVQKEFLIESVSTAKSKQQINTTYYEYFKDTGDNILNTNIVKEVAYIPLSSGPNYREVYEEGAPTVGQKIDQVGINSVLYKLHRVHCYDLDTNTFAPPITADAVGTNCTFTLITPPPNPDPNLPTPPPYYQSNDDGTITVTPVDFVGILSYTIVELQQDNTTGIFENLAAGVYTIYIDSDEVAMPYTIVVEVLAAYL